MPEEPEEVTEQAFVQSLETENQSIETIEETDNTQPLSSTQPLSIEALNALFIKTIEAETKPVSVPEEKPETIAVKPAEETTIKLAKETSVEQTTAKLAEETSVEETSAKPAEETPAKLAEEIPVGETPEPAAEPMLQPERPPSTIKKIMRGLFNLIFYSVLLAILIGSTVFAFSKDPGKSYFGYRFYNVLSNSMVPSQEAVDAGLTGGFQKGDLILIKMMEPEAIQVGDIITFIPDKEANAYLTHRVVEIKNRLNNTEGLYFITRGDANNTNDPAIAADMVVGKKVAVLPHMGTVIEFIRKNLLPVLIFLVAGFGFILVLKMLLAKQEEGLSHERNDYQTNYI